MFYSLRLTILLHLLDNNKERSIILRLVARSDVLFQQIQHRRHRLRRQDKYPSLAPLQTPHSARTWQRWALKICSLILKTYGRRDEIPTRIRESCSFKQDVVKCTFATHEFLYSCYSAILNAATKTAICKLEKLF